MILAAVLVEHKHATETMCGESEAKTPGKGSPHLSHQGSYLSHAQTLVQLNVHQDLGVDLS